MVRLGVKERAIGAEQAKIVASLAVQSISNSRGQR